MKTRGGGPKDRLPAGGGDKDTRKARGGLSSKEKIIRKTSDLLESRGYHGTGLDEIVRSSGAPKGSIYYHFPGGKEEITAEAVRYAGRTLAGRIRDNLAKKRDAAEAIRSFVDAMSFFVAISGYRSGGPLTIVASETATTSKLLNQVCREAYDLILDAFKEKLLAYGLSVAEAESYSLGITAAIEGGTILSRTYHSRKPLRAVAKLLEAMLRAAGGARAPGKRAE